LVAFVNSQYSRFPFRLHIVYFVTLLARTSSWWSFTEITYPGIQGITGKDFQLVELHRNYISWNARHFGWASYLQNPKIHWMHNAQRQQNSTVHSFALVLH